MLVAAPRKYFAISSFNPHCTQLGKHLLLHFTDEHKMTQRGHAAPMVKPGFEPGASFQSKPSEYAASPDGTKIARATKTLPLTMPL